jgi:5'(3')-deoxyribonucleotidase
MDRQTIAVDIDDVLAHHYDVLKVYLAAHQKIELEPEDMRSGLLSSPRIATYDKETLIKGVEEFVSSPEFYSPPIEGSVEVLLSLKEKYRLIIVTARPLSIELLTTEWLEKYFEGIFEEINFVGAKRWGQGRSVSKNHLLEKHGVNYLIDDSLMHCENASKSGIKSLLFGDYEWNKTTEDDESVVRVRNWREVGEYFNVQSR